MWLDDWFRERRETHSNSSGRPYLEHECETRVVHRRAGRGGLRRPWASLYLLCCLLSYLSSVAHGAFTGIYKLQGIRSFPAVKDLQTHCNKIVLSETYHIVKRNTQDIEFRPGYDSYSYRGAFDDQEAPALTSSTFVGHFTGYDTFNGNFHGMLLSNCSGQFLNSMTLLHCPVPKEENFSGRCIITLECEKGPCVETGTSSQASKTPFDVAAVDFFIWLWKRLFLALVVTTTAFAALGLSFFTVNYALQHSRAKRGQSKINLLDWLTTTERDGGRDDTQTPTSPYRRTRSASFLHQAEYLDIPLLDPPENKSLAHKRNKSFASRDFNVSTGEFNFGAFSGSDQGIHRREVGHGHGHGTGHRREVGHGLGHGHGHNQDGFKKIVSVPSLSDYV